jgi:hypothetical protein
MMDLPKNWRPGDDIRDNEHHDATVRAVRRMAGADATGDAEQRARFAPLLARVTTAGPAGEANYTDERYWVKLAWVDGPSDKDVEDAAEPLSFTSYGEPKQGEHPIIFTATNLAEQVGGSHVLYENTPVWVFPIYDGGDPSTLRSVFVNTPESVLLVNLAQTGGAQGTSTTAPTWTYTATLNGSTLGTVLSPLRARPIGFFSAATRGYGIFGSGGFVLLEAWETEGAEACP